MPSLPQSFCGGIRYPFNLWSFFGLKPKGFFVFFEFNKGLEPTGTQEFRGYMQIHLDSPAIGICYGGDGNVNFQNGTISFQSDNNELHFLGIIDSSEPRIEGMIRVDGVRTPHRITFEPAREK